MTLIRVGGVPEHFNLPWHLGIEKGFFEKAGIELEWTTYYGGTGTMVKALRNNEIDICILLTEGIIADIINGSPAKIIGGFIQSPLTWGIHSGINNTLNKYADIFNKKYAISRFGSGSHLMPIVNAVNQKKTINDDQFVVVGTLNDALQSLTALETDVFYWEKYTTKPYVDKGLLKRIAEYRTPWPCFMLAASKYYLESKLKTAKILLECIYELNYDFMRSPDSTELVSKRYKQDIQDVENWFFETEWCTDKRMNKKVFENVQFYLNKANIINSTIATDDIYLSV